MASKKDENPYTPPAPEAEASGGDMNRRKFFGVVGKNLGLAVVGGVAADASTAGNRKIDTLPMRAGGAAVGAVTMMVVGNKLLSDKDKDEGPER